MTVCFKFQTINLNTIDDIQPKRKIFFATLYNTKVYMMLTCVCFFFIYYIYYILCSKGNENENERRKLEPQQNGRKIKRKNKVLFLLFLWLYVVCLKQSNAWISEFTGEQFNSERKVVSNVASETNFIGVSLNWCEWFHQVFYVE